MLAGIGAALDALTGEFAALLTPPTVPAFAPEVTVHAARAGLAGLGGFVGVQASPRAELHARRIDAEVVVRVRAANEAGLLSAEAQAARDVIAADPAFLRRRGILRLERVTDPAARSLAAEEGASFVRDLRFAVRFEHQPVPTEGEGVIGTVPQDVTLSAALTRAGRLRYATEMLANPLGDFEVVNGGTSGTVGAWAYDAAAQEIRQTGTRRGGSNGLASNKAGTYLLLRSAAAGGDLADFLLQAEVRSDGPGGIGLVFDFLGPLDFSFALLEEPAAVRVTGRRAGGVSAFLARGGQDPTRGFPTGQWLRLRLLVEGGRVELAVDEAVALAGADPALAATIGRVGFFCRNNGTARFRHFRLSSL
jgi:hypothetical protein